MAIKTFHFPNSTDSYKLPNGDLLKIEIFRNQSAADTNMTSSLIKLNPVHYRLESDASNNELNVFTGMVEFTNYNNEFINEGVFNSSYETQTFIHIKVNGITKFTGLILFDKIQYNQEYIDGSDIKYRTVTVRFVDALKRLYYKTYGDDTNLSGSEVLTDVANVLSTEMDLNWSGSIIDSAFNYAPRWYKSIGSLWLDHSYTYDASDLRIGALSGSLNLGTMLKELSQDLGMFAYTYSGSLYFSIRTSSGSTHTIDNDNLSAIKRTWNYQPISSVYTKTEMSWSGDVPFYYDNQTTGSAAIDVIYGTLVQNKNKSIDTSLIYRELYVTPTNNATGFFAQTRVNANTLNFAGATSNATHSGFEVERGMVCHFEYDAFGNRSYAPILEPRQIGSTLQIEFEPIVDQSPFASGGGTGRIIRGSNASASVNIQAYDLQEITSEIYDRFYRTSDEIYQIKLIGYDNAPNTAFSIFGNIYRSFDVTYDLEGNSSTFIVRQVG